MGFRDVLEVDGRTVSDRPDRLQRLLSTLDPSGVVARARAVAQESARYNVGSVARDLNYPTMALVFLREAHQQRSAFSPDGTARVGSVQTSVVQFREARRPTIIGSRTGDLRTGDVVAAGRFWIELATGRVWRTQLTIELEHATAHYDVLYGPLPDESLLVPMSMEEQVVVRASARPGAAAVGDIRPAEVLRGQARYSGFKQFAVQTNEATTTGETPERGRP
jgi:hypothetical protein